MRTRFLTAALLACSSLVTATTSARQAGQRPEASFRVEVDFVNVDVTVTDATGAFVRDLRRDEFEVYEDGKRQQLSAFSLVAVPIDTTVVGPVHLGTARAVLPPEPDVRSNDAGAGRVFVLVLDDLHVHPMRTARVKDIARLFVERYVGPSDLVAVIHTSGRAEGAQDFTSSPRLLLAAIDAFSGTRMASSVIDRMDEYKGREEQTTRADQRMDQVQDPYDKLRADQAEQALKTLTTMGDFLAAAEGRRKALVLISEGVNYPIVEGVHQTESGISMFTSPSAPVVLRQMREFIRAAARANIAVYSIDPRGLATTVDEQTEVAGYVENPLTGLTPDAYRQELTQMQDSLRVLSGETGGVASINSNDFGQALGRVVTDTSAYYLLGYHSDQARKDGKYHRIEVKVRRPGVTVRSRAGYTASAPAPPAGALTEANEPSPVLRNALNSPLPLSGVPLRAFATPYKGSRGGSVVVGLEVDARGFSFVQENGLYADALSVAIVALDGKAKFAAGDRYTVDLRLKPETYKAVAAHGLRVLFRLDLPPGRFQIRAAAYEAGNDRTGTIAYDLDVPAYGGTPLALSGVALTAPAAAVTPTARQDPVLAKTLPSPPTTIRAFAPGDTVTGYFEVYGGASAPATVEVVTSLRGPDGQGRVVTQEKTSAAEMKGNGGGVGYAVRVPLANLPPGPYTLRVEAKDATAAGPQVVREVPLTVLGR